MSHLQLVAEAKLAILRVRDDRSVSATEMIESLQELEFEIGQMLDEVEPNTAEE